MDISIAMVEDLTIRQRRSDEILGVCPVCGCDDANFNTTKLKWRCWHCPAKGNITPEEGYVFQEVEEKQIDITKVRELYTSIANQYHDDITDEAVDYLKNRGLTQDTIDKFKLGFCSTRFYSEYDTDISEDSGIVYNNHPALTNRITIPYIVNGETTDIRGRTLSTLTYKPNTPTYLSLSGNHKMRGATYLFNHDVIDHYDRVIITEGEFKAIVGYQFDFPVVATPGIFGWQKEWSELLTDKEVILAADFDRRYGARAPVYMMAKSLKDEIPQLKIAQLSYASDVIDGKIDIDSLLVNGSISRFRLAIRAAVPVNEWLEIAKRRWDGRRHD